MRMLCVTFIASMFLAATAYGNQVLDDIMPHEEPPSMSIEHAEQLIYKTYQRTLKRAPDAGGLETYTDYLVYRGKDAAWLDKLLRNSEEGRHLRQQMRKRRMIWGVSLGMLLGCSALAIRFRSSIIAAFLGCSALAIRFRSSIIAAFRKLPPDTREYLLGSIHIPPITSLLMLLYVYTYFKSTPVYSWVLYAILLFTVMAAIRLPRWLIYTFILIAMTTFVGWGAFIDSKGPHDGGSDRDDGVEIAATMLMRGSNPWNERTQLNLAITTGPSSILLAVPFVALFGEINLLTFIMWAVFLIFVLAGDLSLRNNSLTTIIMVLLLPLSGFLHTLHWSLDELYYGAILLPVLWVALRSNKLIIAGLFGAFICFVRLSYAPVVVAAGLWWLLDRKRQVKDYLRIAAGGLLYVVAVVSVFWGIGGDDVIANNFWHNSQMQSLNDTSNIITKHLSNALGWFPAGPLGSMLIILPLIVISAVAMRRRVTHPFYHMSIAGLLGHTIAFSPHFATDYKLIFVIPALYSIAFTEQPGTIRSQPKSSRLSAHHCARNQGPVSSTSAAARERCCAPGHAITGSLAMVST